MRQSATAANIKTYEISSDDIQIGLKRLARIRANLHSIKEEISDKVLEGVKECRDTTKETIDTIGELNAILAEQAEQ